ncbi:helicase-associated domain-containing protein [Microbacterium hominis]|uniref:helicase-associated domain-containing protein n=1 Tax=Microbacterium hominis TaxID=162426 RepID=UPI0020B81451|nr:helicase-associated domain-containing protein [Microbacterium hominis]
MSDGRGLASWLVTRDDATLAALLAARGVPASTGWDDFFDVAEGLLDASSIDRALVALDRDALHALAGASASASVTRRLAALALVDDAGAPYAPVGARVALLAAQHPDAFTASLPEVPASPPDDRGAAAAAEHVFAAAGSLADVLLACATTPLTRTGSGAISAVDRKRLIEAGAVHTGEELDDHLAVATACGLLHAGERVWTLTDAGEAWLASSTPHRWARIARGWRAALPEGMLTAEGGFRDPTSWPAAYPLDPEWPAVADRHRRTAGRWGILDPAGRTPAWAAGLRGGGEPDPEQLARLLPAEIDRVYLQADLTAIAPGPLAPALDLRLRRMAVRESRAQASTYRFTAGSVSGGIIAGETAESMRAFLRELSLTGIPQPLDYLIESTASRHGLVKVVEDAATGRTRVDSPDPGLLAALSVDQVLRPLGLVESGGALLSRVARDAVYWSLVDARYPVVALDGGGEPEELHRRAAGVSSARLTTPLETYRDLILRLREGHGADGDAAWLARELEQAVRARSEIVVVVRMPDGSERSLTVEAAGLGGGRLRGRDRTADIERTLPVSSIVSVRPA